MHNAHEPVLLDEVLHYLYPNAHSKKNSSFVDATVGYGGHSKEFVKRGTFVLGIDTDKTTLKFAEEVLKEACPSHHSTMVGSLFKLTHGNFKDIDLIVKEKNVQNIYGVLIDLGVSTPQLTSLERGLSFQSKDAELDMRLDTTNSEVRGYQLLNALHEKQLLEMFRNVMEYPEAKKVTTAIVRKRQEMQFKTVGDFLDVIPSTHNRKSTIHPATKAFMALRMAVNSEIPNILDGLPKAFSVLEKHGRLAVISFHSGEDVLVKEFMKRMESESKGVLLTKKPVVPGALELKKNPRARSAKLRVIEKI